VIKRTRLVPLKQVEDYRNAISYLQGEPGADRDRIGIWGSSYAGGHVLSVAAQDARVKAVVSQVPGINGRNSTNGPVTMRPALLDDASSEPHRPGAEFKTGFSVRRIRRGKRINRPQNNARSCHTCYRHRPVLMVAAENDELCRLPDIKAAYEALPGPGNCGRRRSHFRCTSTSVRNQPNAAATCSRSTSRTEAIDGHSL
jgi:acetyl esterase/lipase